MRCKHEWYPRAPKDPKVCPNTKCKSPYWNKPRQNEEKRSKPSHPHTIETYSNPFKRKII